MIIEVFEIYENIKSKSIEIKIFNYNTIEYVLYVFLRVSHNLSPYVKNQI